MIGHDDAGRFDRIVCGIDGSPESIEAARQAGVLSPSGARILLVAVTEPQAVAPGWPTVAAAVLRDTRDAEEALQRARSAIPGIVDVETRVLEDAPRSTLLSEIDRAHAGLVAVGIRGRSRAAGIALGRVATAMAHEARCSVLLARPSEAAAPRLVVAGVDGSAESIVALSVARTLADTLGADLTALVARGGKGALLDSTRAQLDGVRLLTDERGPVEALIGAGADLLVIGSRGLHGLPALGSVSERVAHQARCSVLVVRSPGDLAPSLVPTPRHDRAWSDLP